MLQSVIQQYFYAMSNYVMIFWGGHVNPCQYNKTHNRNIKPLFKVNLFWTLASLLGKITWLSYLGIKEFH